MSGKTDRTALLSAALKAYGDRQCNCVDCLGLVVDAVLPLIADAIEQRVAFWGFPGDLVAAADAALVRSFGGAS